MKKNKIITISVVVTILVLTILFLLIYDWQVSKKTADAYIMEIEKIVNAKRKNPEIRTVIDIKALTLFNWDRLYIFTPYTSEEEINNRLGFDWIGASGIEYFDTFNLLVFTDGRKVVNSIDQPRNLGDFVANKLKPYYTPQNAKFVLLMDTIAVNKGWLLLVDIE